MESEAEIQAKALTPEHTPEQQCAVNSRRLLCFDCGQQQAARSCICQFPLKSYCNACAQMHLQRKVQNMHLLIPIHAGELLTSEDSIPKFIAREVFANQVEDALSHNLKLVSNAREELVTVCKHLHFEVDLYRDFKLQELAEIEEEMKERVEVATKGIEEIRYLASFAPRNEPERLILEEWKNNVEDLQTRLSLFVSSATVDHLIQELPSIAHFYANYAVLYPPTSHQPQTSLQIVSGQSIRTLSLTTLTWNSAMLSAPTELSYHSALCLLPSGDIFACGGQIHNKSYQLDSLSLEVTELKPMRHSRCFHGIIATPDCVYIFGGQNESELRECERYRYRSKKWEDIRSMHKPRTSVTPCRLYLKVYIAGGRSNSFETYNLLTESYDLLGLSSSLLTSTTCVSLESSVMIIAKQGMMEIDANLKPIKAGLVSGSDWWSTLSPIAFNGCVYFCRRQATSTPLIYRVNITTKRLEEVA